MAQGRHVPQALVDLSIKCLQDKTVFNMGEALAPTKRVGKETDAYYIYNISQQFRQSNDIRAKGAPANIVNPTELSTTSYVLKRHALRGEVYDQDRKNADPAVDPDADVIEEVSFAMLRNKEIEVAKQFFTTTSFSVNLLTLSSNSYEKDTTTSTPIDDAQNSFEVVAKSTGKIPNGLALGYKTMNVLTRHQDILDRIKWSERGIISPDILAAVLGVDSVNVSKAIYTTTDEGISATMNFIFDQKMLYYYNNPNPRIKSSNMGITFAGMYGEMTPEIKSYRLEEIEADVYEQNWMYDVRMVLSLAGYMIAAVHS